jgi:hypothetical protein
MKRLLTLALASAVSANLLSAQAHAIVADEFRCTLEYRSSTPGTGNQASSVHRLVAVRQPSKPFQAPFPNPTPPLPGVSYTGGTAEGQFSFIHQAHSDSGSSKTWSIDVSFGLHYQHAMRAISAPEAVQNTCLTASLSICEVGQKPCFGISNACLVGSQNPFDAGSGWAQVDIRDGVPAFSPGPFQTSMQADTGEVFIQCTHVKTWL